MNSQVRADVAQHNAYPDAKGRYGAFGGRFVPETLVPALDRLQAGITRHLDSPEFQAREQVARFASHVDGVVVGSALVETLERGDDVRVFLGSLRWDGISRG
ncbi:MAG TPA: hypothetical protein VNR70_17060 [Steroidobacteraceae bacterium]|jgi:tryptophan synthase beta subunit|nr:hypothetical protein [Steroidobacteraceae bacterium]